jgi:hypothetical protein
MNDGKTAVSGKALDKVELASGTFFSLFLFALYT